MMVKRKVTLSAIKPLIDSGEITPEQAVEQFDIINNLQRAPVDAETPTLTRPPLTQAGGVGLALGQLKGAGSTIYNLGKLASRIPLPTRGGVGRVSDVAEALGASPEYARFEQPKPAVLQPQGPMQQIGYGLAGAAEFALPATKAAVVAPAIRAAVGSSLPARAAATLGGAAAEGAAAGATTLAQGEGDPVVSTLVGFGVPAAWAASAPVRQVMSAYIPSRLINSLIKPQDKYFSFGKDPGGAVAKEGIVETSLSGLVEKIGAKKNQIGQQIDQWLSMKAVAKKKIDPLSIVLNETTKARNAATGITGNQGMVARMDSLETALQNTIAKISGGTGDLTPLQATQLKREIGEQVVFVEDPIEAKANDVLQRIYHGLDEAVDKAVPATKELNERYANLLAAEKSAARRINSVQRSDIRSVKDLLTALLNIPAATATFILGGTAGKTALAAAVKRLGAAKRPIRGIPSALAARVTVEEEE
jgi:hypothetical protein